MAASRRWTSEQLHKTPVTPSHTYIKFYLVWTNLHTCLLNCIKPKVGKTQVATAGKSSLSAKFTYCWTSAPSSGVLPRSWSLDTENGRDYEYLDSRTSTKSRSGRTLNSSPIMFSRLSLPPVANQLTELSKCKRLVWNLIIQSMLSATCRFEKLYSYSSCCSILRVLIKLYRSQGGPRLEKLEFTFRSQQKVIIEFCNPKKRHLISWYWAP